MNISSRLGSVGSSLLLATIMLVSAEGCRGKPAVICAMRNPTTGQQVELYRESRLKVPATYDEKRHIEQWKAEQRKNGFTVEVRR